MDLPDQPYLPGLTARPAEEDFDGLKGVSAPLKDCPAWQAGRRFFDAGYYWEAHEVWEAVWMAAPANSAERHLVQGMIQLANAGLKRRMGRTRAAERLDDMAGVILSEAVARGGAAAMDLSESDLTGARQAVEAVLAVNSAI
ncbi:DUF309 domain-containing protein [Antarctobacter jejuensis]|uniref:DUF309 domain-containing protein n=1 Tax=Antarctobacter jejuensis TaxID=1439938 RepID=UPI003FD170F8